MKNNAKLKNTTTIVKLSQTILVCSYSFVDHVDSLWNGFTTSLWIQYINMLQILRKFIKAERLGNWYLHLKAVSEKLSQLAVLLCAEVKRAVHDMSVAKYSIGEQNKDIAT